MNKADARSEIKRRFSILNHSEKEKETKILFSRAIEYFGKYNSIASYASLSDEFPTKELNILLIEKGTEVFLHRFNILKKQINSNRLIIFATHNRFFANKSDCLLEIVNGNIKTING